jgi:O-antigen ligase
MNSQKRYSSMQNSLIPRPQWQLTCEWLALWSIFVAFFVTYLSVSLTTITFVSAFALILISGNWRERFTYISGNIPALSFWAIFSLFIIGIFYATSTRDLVIHDVRTNIWLLMIPFFMMILKEEVWRQRMISAFLGIMIITVFVSLMKGIFHINPFANIHFIKMPDKKGFVFDHIKQSYAMNIGAFICAYRFLFGNKNKLGYLALFILMAIDILFVSAGRTGYGLFFVLSAYLGFIRFGWRGMLLALFLSVLIITTAFFTSSAFHNRSKSFYENMTHYHQMYQHHETSSTGQRIEMITVAKIMIRQRPWFGYGTGGIRTAMQTVVPMKDRILLLTPTIDSVESIYLNFWLKFGLFGLSVFLLATIAQIKASFQLPQTYRHLIQAVLLTTLTGGFVCSYFQSFQIKHLFGLFFALCFSALASRKEKSITKPFH